MFRHKNINFDYNATGQPTKSVLRAIRRFYHKGCYNPSATYLDGQRAQNAIEVARLQVAQALGCNSDEIFFTSGASEANSWVYANYSNCLEIDSHSHHSLLMLRDDSIVGIKAFPYVVSETGRVLGSAYRDKDNLYFVDLTQAIGKIPINLNANPEIIFASASGHKFGGILGCGILYIKKEYQQNMKPIIYGSQEHGLRGGTENVPAIIAFGTAIEQATNIKIMQKNNKKIFEVTNYILSHINKKIKANGYLNVINITFNNILATTAVQIFDKYGFNISAGSACNAGSERPSEVYMSSGYTQEEAYKTIRLSFSSKNNIREAKKFIKVLNKVIDKYDI